MWGGQVEYLQVTITMIIITISEGGEEKDKNYQWEKSLYDVRRWNRDLKSSEEKYGGIPNPELDDFAYPWGIDEDPVGDLSGDGRPGIAGVDDDLDGLTDEDSQNRGRRYVDGKWEEDEGYNNDLVNDDDEDGLIDEDIRDKMPNSTDYYPLGYGLDNDGDMCGIFDESSKININCAGNLSGSGSTHYYDQGLGPNEINLAIFLVGRGLSQAKALQVARKIVLHKYGEDEYPGINRLMINPI